VRRGRPRHHVGKGLADLRIAEQGKAFHPQRVGPEGAPDQRDDHLLEQRPGHGARADFLCHEFLERGLQVHVEPVGNVEVFDDRRAKELSKNNFYNFVRDFMDDFADGTDAAGDSV
jgi:hypothetical protein